MLRQTTSWGLCVVYRQKIRRKAELRNGMRLWTKRSSSRIYHCRPISPRRTWTTRTVKTSRRNSRQGGSSRLSSSSARTAEKRLSNSLPCNTTSRKGGWIHNSWVAASSRVCEMIQTKSILQKSTYSKISRRDTAWKLLLEVVQCILVDKN